jgi:DNA-binding PadR family transcriptional regulator
MFLNREAFKRMRPEGPFPRGVFRYVILKLLQDKPAHGYEIIQALAERFEGLYVPSAGTVYPRLQKLEERGYVTSLESNGKKVYTITDEGRKFIDEHHELEQEIKIHEDDWRSSQNTEDIRKIRRDLNRLGELLGWEARTMDAEKLGRVREVLSHTYDEVLAILRD